MTGDLNARKRTLMKFLQAELSRKKSSSRVNSPKPWAITCIDTVQHGRNIGLQSADSKDCMYYERSHSNGRMKSTEYSSLWGDGKLQVTKEIMYTEKQVTLKALRPFWQVQQEKTAKGKYNMNVSILYQMDEHLFISYYLPSLK